MKWRTNKWRTNIQLTVHEQMTYLAESTECITKLQTNNYMIIACTVHVSKRQANQKKTLRTVQVQVDDSPPTLLSCQSKIHFFHYFTD